MNPEVMVGDLVEMMVLDLEEMKMDLVEMMMIGIPTLYTRFVQSLAI